MRVCSTSSVEIPTRAAHCLDDSLTAAIATRRPVNDPADRYRDAVDRRERGPRRRRTRSIAGNSSSPCRRCARQAPQRSHRDRRIARPTPSRSTCQALYTGAQPSTNSADRGPVRRDDDAPFRVAMCSRVTSSRSTGKSGPRGRATDHRHSPASRHSSQPGVGESTPSRR